MGTYSDVALKLYSVALRHLRESQGIQSGTQERREIPDASRTRLENFARTEVFLAGDVLWKKPQIEERNGKTTVPISRELSDIAKELELTPGALGNYVQTIRAVTQYYFRFAKKHQ